MQLAQEYNQHCTYFKQRDYGIVDENVHTDVKYGICVGNSVDWIVRHSRFKSEGAKKRIDFLRNEARSSGIARQRAYLEALTQNRSTAESGQTREFTAALAVGGAGMTAAFVNTKAFVKEKANESLHPIYTGSSSLNRYYMIILTFGSDNHCIAAYHSGGKFLGIGSHLYVFEPNFGEIKVPASESSVKGLFKAIAEAYEGYTPRGSSTPSPKYLDRITLTQLSLAAAGSGRARSNAIGANSMAA
ncbi:YopT-type cysteine protease domain-containing protein [Rhizobium sp. LjRoot30]|uniref:YopT-type cysteine protease domain-containing protein n=1 Tax=Rhizobium sp. LjRoot30 TaxID=3342320 RepID=UPI003ED16483